jgi:hypothetical protein
VVTTEAMLYANNTRVKVGFRGKGSGFRVKG